MFKIKSLKENYKTGAKQTQTSTKIRGREGGGGRKGKDANAKRTTNFKNRQNSKHETEKLKTKSIACLVVSG